MPTLIYSLMLLASATAQVPSTAPQSAVSATQTEKPGKIKGVVTYYFNANYGDKADVGSEVILLAGTVEIPSEDAVIYDGERFIFMSQDEMAQLAAAERNHLPRPKPYHDMKASDQTRIDANGAFQFDDVAPGAYTIVFESKHSKGHGQRDLGGRWKCLPIEVKPGRAADASYGFPATAF